jgi:putative ABC transport system ATP-binding protein
VIKLKGISKTYKLGTQTVHALRNVDLMIRDGEFMAIMGPSGSGKSTPLMNIVGCLDRPTGGVYELDGTNVSRLNDNQLRGDPQPAAGSSSSRSTLPRLRPSTRWRYR